MYLYFQRGTVVVENTGGILIDVKREVKGFFLLSEGHMFLFTTVFEL